MERSLIKEVNKANIMARVTSNLVKPTYFGNFFGIEPVTSLRWETLIGSKGVPVMADVISFDASAPEKTRETVAKSYGDIPKIAIKRSMNESDWNKYKQLLNDVNGRSDLKAILDLVFQDLDFCYNGVQARMEWLAMRAMSTGVIALTTSNNNGLVTETDVDFGIPALNKAGVSVNWATSATCTPLADLEARCDYASSIGITVNYIVMRKTQWLQVKNATDTANRLKYWINSTSKVMTTLEMVNGYLAANQLPPIVVIDPSVRIEDGDHARTTVNPWEDERVAFLTDLKIGAVQHAPIAAESSPEVAKKATMVKKDFTLLSKWAELEPFKEFTKAEANAFPVLNDPDTIFLLRTNNATWA